MLALMRFLARMSADVNGERTSLDEAFATTGGHTRVWALIRMYTIMPLKIGFPVEALYYLIS
jgi:hypothetical protein